MKSIALRFTDKFAPNDGTVVEHCKMIEKKGYVWYGKLGAPISSKSISMIMSEDKKKILLIHSGKSKRYWAFIDVIQNSIPSKNDIPAYYREKCEMFGSWFKITRIEEAEKGILAKCKVVSSGATLSEASRKSMSPYFIIEYNEE